MNSSMQESLRRYLKRAAAEGELSGVARRHNLCLGSLSQFSTGRRKTITLRNAEPVLREMIDEGLFDIGEWLAQGAVK